MKALLFPALLLAVVSGLHPATAQSQSSDPLRCRWRMAVAVPDAGNTKISFNGTTVVPHGYAEGFGSGGLSAGAGPMQLEISHPSLGQVATTITLQPMAMNTVVIHVVEETVRGETRRSLKASNYSAPQTGTGSPEILFISLSKAPAVVVTIKQTITTKKTVALPSNPSDPEAPPGATSAVREETTKRQKMTTIPGGARRMVTLKSSGETSVALGDSQVRVEAAGGDAAPAVVIYDASNGSQKVLAAF